MKKILYLLILYFVAPTIKASEEWGAITTKIIQTTNGEVTMKYARFIQIPYGIVPGGTKVYQKNAITKTECASRCIGHPSCLVYGVWAKDNGLYTCILYSKLAKAKENEFNTYYNPPQADNPAQFYEIKV